MLSRELGFASSWKMLTRDKGWIKPLLVLTLVSWIPIVGQIAVLGYGLEWARLTAWGVDSVPKQRGVKYGKVLTTGGIGFLVAFTMGIVLALLNLILFGGVYVSAAFPLLTGMTVAGVLDSLGASILWGSYSLFPVLMMVVVNMFFGTFISAAMMRATVYDSFSAGWRVDRLLQMIGRDLSGFVHTYAISLIGGLITGAISAVVTFIGILFAGIGAFSLAYGTSIDGYSFDLGYALLHMGAFPILVFVLLAIVMFFALQVIGVAMQLVAINAMGQWFCRFDVNRWGVSSAPLPDDVPNGHRESHGTAPVSPTRPVDEVRAEEPASAAQPKTAAQVGVDAAPAQTPATTPVEEPTPVTTPIPMPAVESDTAAISDTAEPTVKNPVGINAVAKDATAEDLTPAEASEELPSANSPEHQEPQAEKKPIPLGPISDDAQDQTEGDGPIQA